MFFHKKNLPKELSQIDNLYGKVISKFPAASRIDYCESLIYRTQNDLTNTKCRIKKMKLKRLLKAAKTERKSLVN